MRPLAKITFALSMLLAACAQAPPQNLTERGIAPTIALPAMNTFSTTPVRQVTRSNSSVASDFMALAFQLESGRDLPVLSRFEGPITVRATGNIPSSLGPDLNRLLARLRREAGIDITRIAANQSANITVEVISSKVLQRHVPNAACFVAPRVSSWAEFKRTRRSGAGDWTTLATRDTMAIFLPGDVSPQEIRDCLHEEIAQTLGPVNDLYHLSDSVFNDDNFHTILTSFDMLILRTFYAPELHSGMTREAVATRLPDILPRLNPNGGRVRSILPITTPVVWKSAMTSALGATGSGMSRRKAARQAVSIAQAQGWDDTRLAFSLFAQGRLSLSTNGPVALSSFLQAGEIYERSPATRLQAAHVAVQLAAYSLSTRQPEAAVNTVNANFNAAMDAENASLLATLLMIKAQALETLGKNEEARIIRLDSLGWARYGFGSDAAIRQHLSEIGALSPSSQKARLL